MTSLSLSIAIDPGANGAVAMQSKDGRVDVFKLTKGIHGIRDIFEMINDHDDNMRPILLERVGGYVPGNSAVAAVTFARHCGILEGMMCALKMPYIQVAPLVWMRLFLGNKINYPPNISPASKKTIRKNIIKNKVHALYPDVNFKITLANADALAMLHLLITNKI